LSQLKVRDEDESTEDKIEQDNGKGQAVDVQECPYGMVE
jgi:hypothetical protein